MNSILLTLFILLPADVQNAAAPPTDRLSLGEIKVVQGSGNCAACAVGDGILDIRYQVTNRSRRTVSCVRQHWIERLGPDPVIPGYKSTQGRRGGRYGVGGTNDLIPARGRAFVQRLRTSDLPSGKYRCFVEIKSRSNQSDGRVLTTASVDFEVGVLRSHLDAQSLADRFRQRTHGNLKSQLELMSQLENNPLDHTTRFALGATQFFGAVERLSQSLHRHGFRNQLLGLPMLRIPIETNPNPDKLSYGQWQEMLQSFVDDLEQVAGTLADIDDLDAHLGVAFGEIQLDLNGDGQPADNEFLWRLYQRIRPGSRVTGERAKRFVISFDTGDVYWLRGYCHLLMAVGEIVLAHDGRELFERVGHIFFPVIDSPYDFLTRGRRRRWFGFGDVDFADVVAFIHLVNLPVQEPDRMTTALRHLETAIALSRRSWASILAETDDRLEWIPNPKQTGVIPGVRVTDQMVDSWHSFLDESEAILAGKKLIPFWRGSDERGINLRRVFTDPRRLDIVLWIQGTAAAPYLEEGQTTTPEFWEQLQNAFGGRFLSFALWFN